jgi:GAF domain-containing protein
VNFASGPFQGEETLPVRVSRLAKAFCGAAMAENRTQRVDDVHAFPGHIACDSASKQLSSSSCSANKGEPFGVLDIDSPLRNRFSEEDARNMGACGGDYFYENSS